MAKVTFRLFDELLQKVREVALRERIPVTALVRECLEPYEGRRRRQLGALDRLDALADRTASASCASWTRESLHPP